jgi:hypothetical protein
MPNDWELTDDEFDTWIEELEEVDRAAAEYLAERIPGVRDAVTDEDARWLEALADTISPDDAPEEEDEVESASAVMALQHADWLGLALGVVRRGAGSAIDPELVQADINGLEEVDGEIVDPAGHLDVLETALLHMAPQWEELGVLDEDERLTERGAWGLPRALLRIWDDKA